MHAGVGLFLSPTPGCCKSSESKIESTGESNADSNRNATESERTRNLNGYELRDLFPARFDGTTNRSNSGAACSFGAEVGISLMPMAAALLRDQRRCCLKPCLARSLINPQKRWDRGTRAPEPRNVATSGPPRCFTGDTGKDYPVLRAILAKGQKATFR